LARPEHATALFTDHVFLAMVAHLAGMYGGLDNHALRAYAAPKEECSRLCRYAA
jgi:hypothetical protein